MFLQGVNGEPANLQTAKSKPWPGRTRPGQGAAPNSDPGGDLVRHRPKGPSIRAHGVGMSREP